MVKLPKNRRTICLRESGSLLAVFWFVFWVCFQLQPATPYGTQCPTAPIQRISIAVRNCCGSVAGMTSRTPIPGDKGFVQCRCAEKKGLPAKISSSEKPQLIFSVAAQMGGSRVYLATFAIVPGCADYRSLDLAPSVRPPDWA